MFKRIFSFMALVLLNHSCASIFHSEDSSGRKLPYKVYVSWHPQLSTDHFQVMSFDYFHFQEEPLVINMKDEIAIQGIPFKALSQDQDFERYLQELSQGAIPALPERPKNPAPFVAGNNIVSAVLNIPLIPLQIASVVDALSDKRVVPDFDWRECWMREIGKTGTQNKFIMPPSTKNTHWVIIEGAPVFEVAKINFIVNDDRLNLEVRSLPVPFTPQFEATLNRCAGGL